MRITLVFVLPFFALQACAGDNTPDSSVLIDSGAPMDSGASRVRAWSAVNSPTTEGLFGIWGSGPDDVWAVGGSFSKGTIVHWDGSSWSTVPCPPSGLLSGVWGSGPNDV